MQKNIVIFGATSAIAQEVAKLYAEKNNALLLIGRNEHQLVMIVDDLKVRGCQKVSYIVSDLVVYDKHPTLIHQMIQNLETIDLALIAYGFLPEQKACEQNVQLTLAALDINFTSAVSLLTLLANYFEQQKKGCIAVISSVAGDRGRQSNYVYGAAKAGLTTFLQGLRHRLQQNNVQILTIKPGFVDTPMTKHYKKHLLFAKPSTVAKTIVKAIESGRHVLYTPWFWRYIMLVVKVIPEKIFQKLSL